MYTLLYILLLQRTALAYNLPSLESLSGDWQTYHRGLYPDVDPPEWKGVPHGIALPTANSLVGSLIASENVFAIRSLTFPPFTSGPYSTVERNSSQLGLLSINGEPVFTEHYRWSPYGFNRKGSTSTVQVHSEVRLPLSDFFVMMTMNFSSAYVDYDDIELQLNPNVRSFPANAVNCSDHQIHYPEFMQRNCWNWYAPRSFVNESAAFVEVDDGVWVDHESGAITSIKFAKHENTYRVVIAFGNDVGAASMAQAVLDNFDAHFEAAKTDREERFKSVFDDEDDKYFTGSLPTLETDDVDLERVYYSGVVGFLELHRHVNERNPHVPHAPPNTTTAYVTGSGENCTTNIFFWDIAYAATSYSLLDPVNTRASILYFIKMAGNDNESGWGIDLMGGINVGNHYAANDFSIFKLSYNYVAVTGDYDFLNELVEDKPVIAWMENFALAFKNNTRNVEGGIDLADYGESANLLECVPSYEHKVAAFNSANVWMMKVLSNLIEISGEGEDDKVKQLRDDADELAAKVLELYQNGQGVFAARSLNDTDVPVRTVIDFVYTTEFMSEYFPREMADEMVKFVSDELLTESWMRALSLSDEAAKDSDRTDHGPNGAYNGWPALTSSAMIKLGHLDEGVKFLIRTAQVTKLGPHGQATGIIENDDGIFVAYKPFEVTLFNEVTSLDFVESVLVGVFGLDLTNSLGSSSIPSLLSESEPRGVEAKLRGLRFKGGLVNLESNSEGIYVTDRMTSTP